MASTVEICNRALQKLGANTVISLTDNSVNARACNLAFEPCKKAELRSHTWNFAIKRAQLSAEVPAPIFGKQNQFPVPNDFLRLLPPDPLDNLNDLDWQIEGRKILTDFSAPLEIRYIYDVTDPNEMDAIFREALSTRIALEICEQLTQSNTKKADLKDDYKQIIQTARRTNAIENIAAEPPEDVWITTRA